MNDTIRRGEDEVAAERSIGEGGGFTDHLPDVIGPCQRQHAKGTGIGDGRGQSRYRDHRRLDDRMVYAEVLAERGAHPYDS
jgi:hypothetical protein